MKEKLEQALKVLEDHHNERTRYSQSKRRANATCAEFNTNSLQEMIEAAYVNDLGKQTQEAITAIKEALAQPEQESVAEAVNVPRDLIGAACSAIEHKRDAPNVLEKLRRYTVGDLSLTTKPQRKPWASLSEKEVEDICKSLWSGGWRQKAFNDFSKLHDAKLRELNEAPAKPLTDEQWMIEMVDAAMVATRDIVPRITRSQCRLIIEAAHGIKG